MTKRKFEGKELVFATRGLGNKKQEKEWILYQLAYHKLMLDTGLEMNYKKNIRDFKQQQNEFENDLIIVESTIKTLQEQIRNGVEIIEEKDKKEEN